MPILSMNRGVYTFGNCTFGNCNVVTAPKPGFSGEESEFEEESSHYDTAEDGEMEDAGEEERQPTRKRTRRTEAHINPDNIEGKKRKRTARRFS